MLVSCIWLFLYNKSCQISIVYSLSWWALSHKVSLSRSCHHLVMYHRFPKDIYYNDPITFASQPLHPHLLTGAQSDTIKMREIFIWPWHQDANLVKFLQSIKHAALSELLDTTKPFLLITQARAHILLNVHRRNKYVTCWSIHFIVKLQLVITCGRVYSVFSYAEHILNYFNLKTKWFEQGLICQPYRFRSSNKSYDQLLVSTKIDLFMSDWPWVCATVIIRQRSQAWLKTWCPLLSRCKWKIS